MKKKIVLTGNMGCGKSAVAQLLEQHLNIVLVDTDRLAKEIAGRPEHSKAIRSIVGFNVDFSNSADRSRLAQLLFSDKNQLIKYQEFIHPLVWDRIDFLYNQSPDCTLFFIETAILFESKTRTVFDKIVVITCEEGVQIGRIRSNRDISEADIRTRINCQIPQAQKATRADYVIDNSGSQKELEEKVSHLYNQLNHLL